MTNIQLEGKTMDAPDNRTVYGRNIDKAPALLARWKRGEGYIPSEADVRLIGIRNFKNAPEIATNYWDISTLSATKKDAVKVILPYNNSEDHRLTESAEFGLALINPNERLVNYGINLDIDGRWEKLGGKGVYTLKRKGMILDQDLTKKQAMEHPLLLTKLGHPDYVDAEFARSKEEVAEIIDETFKLGKSEHDYGTMMGQYLPDESKKGVMKAWCVGRLVYRAGSSAWSNLGYGSGRFAFISVGDANANAEGVDADRALLQANAIKKVVNANSFPMDEIYKAIQDPKRNVTVESIYSALSGVIASDNVEKVKKTLEKLLGQ